MPQGLGVQIPPSAQYILNMREITRREFFKEAAFFTARVALPFSPFGRLFDFPHIQEDPLSALNFLKDLDPPPEHLRLPPNLRGIYVNIPFAWDKPNDISTLQMIDQAATLGTSNLRIIIDNRLIAPDGTYNKDVVRKIRRFSEHVRERTEQKVGLLVTLYDDNFGEFETKGRPDLFGSQTTKNAFKDRLRYLVSSLGDIPSITAWGVGNEIEVREHKPVNEQKTIHTDFFMEMITAIRQEDPTRWILTGTRRAYCIDDKSFSGKRVAMTDHQYPGFSSDGIDAQPIFDPNDAIEMKRYIQTMSTPLVIRPVAN